MMDQIKQILDRNNHLSLWNKIIHEHCQVIENDYFTLVDTGVNFAVNNGIYQTHIPNDRTEVVIKDVVDYFRNRHLPFIWILNSLSSPSSLKEKLLNYGFSELFIEAGMALNLTNSPIARKGSYNLLRIEEVNSIEHSRIFALLSIGGFGLPHDICYNFYLKYPLITPFMKRIIIYDEKIPIGVGLVLLLKKYAVLHNITVLPQYRNKGIGTQISIELFNFTRNAGISVILLHASKEGENLYRKLGFITYNQQQVLYFQD